jgi:hypothetical protein
MTLRRFFAFFGQGSLYRPAKQYPALDHSVTEAKFRAPLCHGLCLISELNKYVCGFVVHLFEASCPSAIMWAVVAVIVNSVKRVMRGRPGPHISNEPAKIMPPTANGDSPSAVAMKQTVRVIGAPLQHVRPDHVFAGNAHSVRRSFASSAGGGGFLQTPARLYVSGLQSIATNRGYFAALAKAHPPCPVVSVGKPQYKKTLVVMPAPVNDLAHGYFLAEASQNERWQTHARMGFSGATLASNKNHTTTGVVRHV